ncbi:hypothetical protein QFZ82_007296 [Streptomyces sp. V4I23]|nr:hypothetical protein [Streptomyces sp. V4I23]
MWEPPRMTLALPAAGPRGSTRGRWSGCSALHQSAHHSRHCPTCCGGRSRWGRRRRPGPFPGIRRPRCSWRETVPAGCCSGSRRPVQFVAPRVTPLLQTAPRGVLPFRLRGQPLSRPAGGRRGVVPGDVRDGVVTAFAQGAARPLRPAPGRPLDAAPPGRAGSSGRAAPQRRGEEAGEHAGPADAFGVGDVAGVVGEGGEALVAHRVRVDVERSEPHRPDRPFLVVGAAFGVVGAHEEFTAGQQDHARRRAGGPTGATDDRRGRRPTARRHATPGAAFGRVQGVLLYDRNGRTMVVRVHRIVAPAPARRGLRRGGRRTACRRVRGGVTSPVIRGRYRGWVRHAPGRVSAPVRSTAPCDAGGAA